MRVLSRSVDCSAPIESSDRARRPRSSRAQPTGVPGDAAASLVQTGTVTALITVSTRLFRSLPGVRLIPLSSSQSFLALEPGKGMADLELAVIDRLETGTPRTRELQALQSLLQQLRQWRRDRTLAFESRSIILVHRRRSRG